MPSMSAKVKSWLLLGGIFAIGIVTGVALTVGIGPHFMRPPGAQEMRERWMMMLSKRLELTPDQQAKIEPILTDAENKIQALHHEEVMHGSEIIRTANDQIAAVLTADQKVKLQQLEAERQKMFWGRLHSWGPPGGPGEMHRHWDDGDHPPPPGAPAEPNPPSSSPPPAPPTT